MKKIVFLLTFPFLILSCEQTINGNIKDNFNKPVENVTIKITNSDYKSTSDSDGEFAIPFSAGKFQINFEKEHFLFVEKELELVEHKSHPLGLVEMIRIPDTTGFYFKGIEDYIKIPLIDLKTTEISEYQMFIGNLTKTKFFLPNDSIFQIEIDSVCEVEFFDRSEMPLTLFKADNDYVATYEHASRYINNASGKKVKTIKEKIGNSTTVWRFTPEHNASYVFMKFIDNKILKKSSFAFKFIKKTK